MWEVGQEICACMIYGHLWLTAIIIAKTEELDSPGFDLNGDGMEARLARAAKMAGCVKSQESRGAFSSSVHDHLRLSTETHFVGQAPIAVGVGAFCLKQKCRPHLRVCHLRR